MAQFLNSFVGMKRTHLFMAVLLGLSGNSFAQEDEDWMLYKPGNGNDSIELDSSIVSDTIIEAELDFIARTDSADFFNPNSFLNFDTNKVGSIKINSASGLDDVLKSMGTPNAQHNVQIEGYRVQVFFDQDRDKVLVAKTQFLAAHPEIETYMDWQAPYHYLRIGNYHTEQRARKIAEDLKLSFPTATIYRCKIDLPDLDLNNDN